MDVPVDIFGHLANIPPMPAAPEFPGQLGTVPGGFFEIAEPAECHDLAPAFIRGLLMPRADYDALPQIASPPQLSKTGYHLTPRWALYGGPIATKKDARERWQPTMQFWAQGQGRIWLPFPDGEPCVVASNHIPWPANSGFRWTWVREAYPPQRVVRDKTSIHHKYVWESSVYA